MSGRGLGGTAGRPPGRRRLAATENPISGLGPRWEMEGRSHPKGVGGLEVCNQRGPVLALGSTFSILIVTATSDRITEANTPRSLCPFVHSPPRWLVPSKLTGQAPMYLGLDVPTVSHGWGGSIALWADTLTTTSAPHRGHSPGWRAPPGGSAHGQAQHSRFVRFN